MKFIRGLENIQRYPTGCVVAIGNFDGVHRGHQVIIENLIKESLRHKIPSVVVVFEPQPKEYFLGDKAPSRLTNLREKIVQIKQFGVQNLVCLHFNKKIAELSPAQFIEEILVKKLGVRYLIVGDDFRFGRNREGDFVMLSQAGLQHNFIVEVTPSVAEGSVRISSTLIRDAIAHGEFVKAKNYLGRFYSVMGKVIKGDHRGKSLQIPTANIALKRQILPLSGVFIVSVIYQDRELPGVACVGERPMFKGRNDLLEVHLLEFDKGIYGESIAVIFKKKIREQAKFKSLVELQQQMLDDIGQAKAYFR